MTLTPPVAQIALRFGADDLDGTIIEERIIHGAGTPTSLGMPRAQIEKLIRPEGQSRGSAYPDPLPECLPFQQLHHDEGLLFMFTKFVNGTDVGCSTAEADRAFALEFGR